MKLNFGKLFWWHSEVWQSWEIFHIWKERVWARVEWIFRLYSYLALWASLPVWNIEITLASHGYCICIGGGGGGCACASGIYLEYEVNIQWTTGHKAVALWVVCVPGGIVYVISFNYSNPEWEIPLWIPIFRWNGLGRLGDTIIVHVTIGRGFRLWCSDFRPRAPRQPEWWWRQGFSCGTDSWNGGN